MKRLSVKKQEIWKELLSYVDKNPSKLIKDMWYYIFVMPSRIWESTWFLDKMDKPGKVLDLGCGNPAHMVYLAKHGFQYTGIDPKFEGDHLKIYNDYLDSYLSKDIRKNITIFPTRMEKIKWINEFDYVISISVVEHINFPIIGNGIQRAMKALKPDGKMLLTIDQKITKDGGNTYILDSLFKLHKLYKSFFPLSKYYEDIILTLEQSPETTLSYHEDILKIAGIYLNLEDYIKNNPDKWAKDFPEFLHQPYGLEFVKKERKSIINYSNKIWEFYNNNKSYDKIKYIKISDIEKKYNLEDIIDSERLNYGYFWSQQKINNIILDLESGKKIKTIRMKEKNGELSMQDGFHRAYVIKKLYGNETFPIQYKEEL